MENNNQQNISDVAPPVSDPINSTSSSDPSPPAAPPLSSHTVQKPQKKEGGIVSFLATLVIAFVLVQIINAFFFQSYKVFGSSMVPTLHDGDRLIISKLGKTTSKIRGKDYVPKRGDVIVFVDPLNSDLQLIKRVIGLPGERVVVKDGSLRVYNAQNPEGFNPDTSGIYKADLPKTSGENDVSVPDKHLFVSGDNREGSNSLDSRNELGTVPEDLVIGTLQVRIWPFGDARFF
jgi:signal peptidase I